MSTLDENILGSPDANESEYPFMPYDHEEFELHATNAVSRVYKRILIIANGTVIIVLGHRSSMILALTNCGLHLELDTNCFVI